jgi:hypothetical protein
MNSVSHSYFRQHIDDHFDDHDLDMAVRKRKQSYNVYWACDDEPLARLRPTGKGDEVEVFWWDDDRWQPAKEFGLALPLDEALQYVTDDPDDLFFNEDPDEEDGETDNDELELHIPRELRENLEATARVFHLYLSACSMFGAAAGGMFAGLPWALLAGATAAFSSCAILVLWGSRGRGFVPAAYMASMTAASACVGSISGSAVHGALAGTFWPLVCGALVGGLCNWLLWHGGFWAWVTGFLAALNLAVFFVGLSRLDGHFSGYLIVALFATVGAGMCRGLVGFVLRPVRASDLIGVVLDVKDAGSTGRRD